MKILTLEAPGKNALGTGLMDHVLSELEDAGGQPLLMTGAGDTFSAGLNLREVATLNPPGMRAFLDKLERMAHALYTYPGPTVACVNGHAIAGGCILAMCCDHRIMIANPRARIGLNEVAIGLRFPPTILNIVLARTPLGSREQIVLGAQLYGPADALRVGLLDEVSETPRADSERRLALLAGHPAQAYALTKADLRGDPAPTAEETDRFVDETLPIWTSDAVRERILAVLER